MKVPKHDERAIVRRIEFLLTEAKSSNGVYDDVVQKAMRTISDFYSIGKSGGSNLAKRECRKMSHKAYDLKQHISQSEWFKKTHNEHQKPLKQGLLKKRKLCLLNISQQNLSSG